MIVGLHTERHAPPFLTLVDVFASSLSLPTTQTEQGLYSATAPAEVAEHPALTSAVAHSARPRPMVTPTSCFQCFPKSIALQCQCSALPRVRVTVLVQSLKNNSMSLLQAEQRPS